MRCPLCGGPLRADDVGGAEAFACIRGHNLTPDELRVAMSTRVGTALWMAIEALETEAEALRRIAPPEGAEGDGGAGADRAEADARLLRDLASAHLPGEDGERDEKEDGRPGDAHDRLEAAVRAVGQFLVADVPLGTTLHRIAELACEAVPQAVAVGVTLIDERQRPTTAVYTDQVSPAVDQGQYEDGDGPCLTAFREHRVVRVDDTGAVGARWPRFSRDAVDQGVHSTLSLPLVAGGDGFGAVNLYARRTGAFGEADEAAVSLFVTQASVVLTNARAYWTTFELASGFEQAMQARAVIEQAKGKVMATSGCSADEAFAVLVRASQRENVKLRDIARRIVERGAVGEI